MRIRLLLLFLISLLFFNCNTEDDSTVNLHPIVGEWQLIETRDGFSGGSTFYNQNDVVVFSAFFNALSLFLKRYSKKTDPMYYAENSP